MSCRSSAGNSAVTSHARITTGLSDMQTLSSFHALVREGAALNVANPTRQRVEEWVERRIAQIRNNENLTPARRSSLINRLEQVRRPDAPLPDGSTFYAWLNLDMVMDTSRLTLDREFERLARVTSIPPELVRRRFEIERTAADANSGLTVPPEFVEQVWLLNQTTTYHGELDHYPMDRGTLYALRQIRSLPVQQQLREHYHSQVNSETATDEVEVADSVQLNASGSAGATSEEIIGTYQNPSPSPSRRRATTPTTTQRRQRQAAQANSPVTAVAITAPASDQRQAQVDGEREREREHPTPLPSALQTQVGRRFQFIDRHAIPQPNPIIRQPVTSSAATNIASMGYDPVSRRLQLGFSNGQVHEYRGVEPEIYQELIAPGVDVSSTFDRLVRFDDRYTYQYRPDHYTDPQPSNETLSSSPSPSPSAGSGSGSGSGSEGGIVMRCPECGEFISATTAHQCRGRGQVDNNGGTLTEGSTTTTTTSAGSPSVLAVEIAVPAAEIPEQSQAHTQVLLELEPEPTATPEALERALLATSFGNVTNEQLRTIRYSQFPFLSPPASNYSQSFLTNTITPAPVPAANMFFAPPSTTTTTLTSPTPAAVRGYFGTRGTGYDVNIMVGASQTDVTRSTTNDIQSTRNDFFSVEGSILLHHYLGSDDIRVEDASNLRCTCSNFRRDGTCNHITQTVQAIEFRYNASTSQPSPETLQRRRDAAELRLNSYLQQEREASEAARRAAIAAAEAARQEAEAAAAAARQEAQAQAQAAQVARVNAAAAASASASVTATGDSRYGQNMAAFQRSYDAAKERKARGEAPISYLRENATNGLGAREGGRGFGVEIEFDLDHLTEPQKIMALVNIGNELHASGITTTPDQQRYHSTRGDYSQWRYERDRSVSGEIVSPILYDEPETWERLEKVCEIVRRHGGKATTRTGSHVHVACDNYDHNPRNHNNLLRLFKQNEDVVYRLAQNPEANNHRGTFYCTPNAVPARDYTSVAAVNSAFTSHRVGLNFGAVTGSNSDHVEFRMWDGTLDPAAIQTQVKLSLAMTEAAFRADAGVFRGNSEPLGTHRQSSARNQAQAQARTEGQGQGQGQGGGTGTGEGRLSGEAWEQDTSSFRNFVDTLFTRAQDKEQLTSLFAVTKWQTS